jgi:hypothetical protein
MTILDGNTNPSENQPGGNPSPGAGNNPPAGGGGQASWRDGLPDDLKNDPSLTAFNDLPSLAKSYIDTKKYVGKKGVFVPGEKASDEEWNTFYDSLGRPALDKYELGAPKDAKVDEKLVGAFKQIAHKAGVLPKQASAILNSWLELEGKTVAEKQKIQEASVQKGLEDLRAEWGNGFDKQIALATAGAQEVGGEEFLSYLQEAGINTNPKILKAMAKIGSMLSEDKIRGAGGGGKLGSNTPEEIQKQIDQIMGDLNHPYFDKSHAGHSGAVREMESLYRQLPQ